MGNEPEKHIHIPSLKPYIDEPFLKETYLSYQGCRCPQCGSPHVTRFKTVMKNEVNGEVLSGDLSYKIMEMVRCLSCGQTAPSSFTMPREI